MGDLLLYLVSIMDPIVGKDFVIVYYLSQTSSGQEIPSLVIKKLFEIGDDRFIKNLQGIYLVHPTFFSKALAWYFTTFLASGTGGKTRNVGNLRELFASDRFDPDQLDVPDYVLEYDRKVNGSSYSASNPNLGSSGRDEL